MIYTSVLKKNWVLKQYDTKLVEKYCEKYSFDELTSRLLVIKKIEENNFVNFLNPTIKNTMPSPYSLIDMEKAVKKIFGAILNKQKIGIFGDYDVDGASSSALLGKFFNHINHPYEIFIPDRVNDGYGPTIKSFDKLINKGIKVIITVDCGVGSFEAVEYANQKKVDVVILDHHQCEIILPKANAIVNPNRIDCTSNLNYLCAAGVTFLFLVALNGYLVKRTFFKNSNIKSFNLINYLDLVCLGTICDVVPLIKFNRSIVKQGLQVIKQRKNTGIRTLYDLIKINQSPNAYHIAFQIGPRINAGGRVGNSSYGSKLLLAENHENALKISSQLNVYNSKRQILQEKLFQDVEKEAEKLISSPVLILSGRDWHQGVIGIVASKIKDKFQKPTVLISLNGDKGKGSARSVYGFDIGTAFLSALKLGLIENGGGHKMAGGFSINKSKINLFKNFLFNQFNKSKGVSFANNNTYIDGKISSSALNEDFFNKINILAPYGAGNSEPIFLIENIKVVKAIPIGKNHLRVIFISKNNVTFNTIAFNCVGTELGSYLSTENKKMISIIGKISLNEWRGRRNIEFIIEDISVIKTQ